MTIYFREIIGDKHNYFEVDHSRRHLLWKEKPNAKEINKKEYLKIKREAEDAENASSQPIS